MKKFHLGDEVEILPGIEWDGELIGGRRCTVTAIVEVQKVVDLMLQDLRTRRVYPLNASQVAFLKGARQ